MPQNCSVAVRRNRVLEEIVVWLLFQVMVLLRWLFLSGRRGARLHNLIYYAVWRLVKSGFAGEERLLEAINMSLEGDCEAVYRWQKQNYLAAPATWRHAFTSKFTRRRIFGSLIRRRLAKLGFTVPSNLVVSLNTPKTGCNLACTTCYASARGGGELPPEVLRKVLREQEALGIYSVLISGGEPLLYRGLLEIIREFPHTSFNVITNGTLFTKEIAKEMAEMGNVLPLFSLEGFEKETDQVRGKGVFNKVLAATNHCQSVRLPYCVSITVTSLNFAVVTSDTFLAMLQSRGCMGVVYSTYLALGGDPHQEWEISTEQSEELECVRRKIKAETGMMSTVGRNGTSQITQCGAGSEYFHVLPSGLVEPCHFVHYADPEMNIKDHTILAITSSPFFQEVRELTACGIPGLVPCCSHKSKLVRQFLEGNASPTS